MSIKQMLKTLEIYSSVDVSTAIDDLKNVCNVENIELIDSEEYKVNLINE